MLAVCVAAVATSTASARQSDLPPGFSDGHWHGSIHWQALLAGDDVVADAAASGSFEVQWSAGAPTGVMLAAGSGSSSLEGGSATLAFDMSASFQGTPGAPVLAGEHLAVSGTATAQGFTVPVELTFGAGELGTIPMDVRAASCTTISGDFQSHVANLGSALSGVGVLMAPVAFWTAVRTGDGATLSEDQLATMNALLAEADLLEQGIAAGTFDGAALHTLLARAEEFSYSLARGADCGRPPGTYGHVLSGMVARILDAMIATSGQFSAEDWYLAVLAAAASGVIGPGSGATGAGYVGQLVPVLQALIDIAFAAGNATDLLRVMLTASIIGDAQLWGDANQKYEALL